MRMATRSILRRFGFRWAMIGNVPAISAALIKAERINRGLPPKHRHAERPSMHTFEMARPF